MTKWFIAAASIFITIMIGCQFVDKFRDYYGKDLLTALDLSNDWVISEGVTLDETTEAPPPGETKVYYLSMKNYVYYDTFESSSGPADFGNWQPSLGPNDPDIYEVTTDMRMTGSKFLHLRLDRSTVAQYFYHVISSDVSKDYIFRFDYIYVGNGGKIQLSFGENANDDIRSGFDPIRDGLVHSGWFDISTYKTSANYQVRFGFANNAPDPETYEAYIDNIALFHKNDNSLRKTLNIEDSSAPKIIDGSGNKFYSGIYKFSIFAKMSKTDKITLKLGASYKTFTLTGIWQKLELVADVLAEDDYIILDIIPAKFNDADRFPGSIYISRPHLYFQYN
jgi:hypothetical protein